MALNYVNLFISSIVLLIGLMIYYKFFLSIDEGENKRLKMFKRVISLVMVLGFIHMYSQNEDKDIQVFLIVVFAVFLNVYTVISSTRKCNFPRMYIIWLSLYSAIITLALAGLLWYATNNTLFGFIILDKDERDQLESDVNEVFRSSDIYEPDERDRRPTYCPEPNVEDYDRVMNRLHNNDLSKFNSCLEYEVRRDLEDNI